MVYAPSALLDRWIGLPAAVTVWLVIVAGVSIALSWPDVPTRVRPAIIGLLAMFIAFAWPSGFAQREQFAMLLVYPYVVPGDRRGWRAITIGLMAGIGFSIKPHFLLAWILIDSSRRPLRTEQLALFAAGAIYALSMLTLFRSFTFELLHETLVSYSAFNRSNVAILAFWPSSFSIAALLLALWKRELIAKAFAVAACGFALAAILQMKFYAYQLIPAWGFATLALSSLVQHQERKIRICAIGLLLISALLQMRHSLSWFNESAARSVQIHRILEKIDGARTFSVFGVHPYPAFPTAIYAQQKMRVSFVGIASSQWFLPAAAMGKGNSALLARQQALRELRSKPDIILVDTDWQRHTNISRSFDGLKFLQSDSLFRHEWSQYDRVGSVGDFLLFKRRSPSRERSPSTGPAL